MGTRLSHQEMLEEVMMMMTIMMMMMMMTFLHKAVPPGDAGEGVTVKFFHLLSHLFQFSQLML